MCVVVICDDTTIIDASSPDPMRISRTFRCECSHVRCEHSHVRTLCVSARTYACTRVCVCAESHNRHARISVQCTSEMCTLHEATFHTMYIGDVYNPYHGGVDSSIRTYVDMCTFAHSEHTFASTKTCSLQGFPAETSRAHMSPMMCWGPRVMRRARRDRGETHIVQTLMRHM